ncbi:MAG: flagellar export chaperone FliS [Nocardioidaceae bacterium]
MNYAQSYVNQSVATAGPERLLVMLVDRLALDVRRGAAAQEVGDHATASQNLMHAQEIVLELKTSLRLDVWDGAQQLADIYTWLYSQLIKANTSRDVTITRDCLKIIEPLAETWREAALVAAAS